MGKIWRLQYFWIDIVKFLLGLTAVMTVISLFTQLFSLTSIGEFIGYCSMSIESILGLPQVLSNWKTKSVKGLSYTMIALWFLGDLSKTFYFIA
jgi:hypothetical protein